MTRSSSFTVTRFGQRDHINATTLRVMLKWCGARVRQLCCATFAPCLSVAATARIAGRRFWHWGARCGVLSIRWNCAVSSCKEATLGVTDNRNLLPVPETRVYGTRLRVRRVDPGDPDLPVTAQSGPALNSVWGGAGPRQAARQQTARQHCARAPRLCCGTHTLFPHLCIFPGSVGSYNVGRQRTCRAPPP